MIAAYNAQDADSYVTYMTDDACEAGYRGAVLRDGKEGVRSGLKAMFADFPENRVEIVGSTSFADYVVLHERVTRGVKAGDTEVTPGFDVLAVYSFEGEKVSRVEFIR
ncbi:MAG: nuclear transport factor 2 family protein [Sphingobium sp.]